ncbi:type IV toxin-antitoxin system AbiEi family antitoxin [Flagellimonas sp.]|uniref:type IV toxin-antitoxin system AbiEi family antitoxin n=1 Tax=Flagellimonas sp. TaxID=2058762 RepID=UPI003BAFA79A
MNDKEIIQVALENIDRTGLLKARWLDNAKGTNLDGAFELEWQNRQYTFNTKVKKELRNAQLPQLEALANDHPPFLILAQRIFPKIKEALRERQIPYLEANGNIYLEHPGFLIWLDTNPPIPVKSTKTNRAFTKTGLKVVFQFLEDEQWINRPYRDIANQMGLGIGTIVNVIKGLEQEGFLIKLTKKDYALRDKPRLLEKWIMAYEKNLKPTLFLGNFRFLNPDDQFQWQDIDLATGRTFWGGEPAGDIYTDYLRPEEFTLYTAEERGDIMRNYKLVPDSNGTVRVYEKFWTGTDHTANVAPPLLAYADLIMKGDRRCRETAEKIYDGFLQGKI